MEVEGPGDPLPVIGQTLARGSTSAIAMSHLDRITINPNQLGGTPCIRGMRIGVPHILEMLASGMTYDEILQDFPYLERGDILASLEYASQRERDYLASVGLNPRARPS